MSEVSEDRAAGALVGLGVGDALGAGYEFTTPDPDEQIDMIGGGPFGFEPGEWTDDTQMAICIAQVTASGSTDPIAIAASFLDWFRSGPKDVGAMTASVLAGARDAAALAQAARAYRERNPDRSAGNGSLMRTAPVALAHLGDDDAIVEHARAVSALTHADPLAQEACVLWCIGIDRAVRETRLDGVGEGIGSLPPGRRDRWAGWLRESYDRPPGSFTPNGYVVHALQAAHSAIVQTPIGDGGRSHLVRSLRNAVRIGHDTDTVAAIAGQLLGARWGVTAIPFRWRRAVHGWPGHDVADLIRLAVLTARGGAPDAAGWPEAGDLSSYYASTAGDAPIAVPVPDDPDLIIGNVAGLSRALHDHHVDTVVSMCRVGHDQVPRDVEHHQIMLKDTVGANTHLQTVLQDTVDAVTTLRAEGRRVFLHCAGGTSRTPTVAALYLARREGISGEDALERVKQVIGHSPHNTDFTAAIARAGPDDQHRVESW